MMRTGKQSTRKFARLKRARKIRSHVARLGIHRLCVNRTPRHIYAQVVTPDGSITVASVSSLEKEVALLREKPGKMEVAKKVGELVARRVLDKGVDRVAFDRSGFRYHGRVKALADAARANGLIF